MNRNFWSFWKHLQDKFVPNRKEELDELIVEIANTLTNGMVNQNKLSNLEIGYVIVELDAAIKARLENRRKLLEKELSETVEVLNLI